MAKKAAKTKEAPTEVVEQKELNVYNATAHDVSIWANGTYSERDRKWLVNEKSTFLHTFPKATPVNCEIVEEDSGVLEIEGKGIALKKTTYPSVGELPDGYDYYIVSALYVSACKGLGKDTSKLLTIGNPLFEVSPEGQVTRPVGCLNLICN